MKYAYVNGILLNGSADMAAQEGKVVSHGRRENYRCF